MSDIKWLSITTWTRLEPRSRDAEMSTSLQARIYDPLWLLARQWQLGEFEGEDNGSPVVARWRGETARLTRYRPGGPGIPAVPYESRRLPLETLVERERVRPEAAGAPEDLTPEKLTFAVRSGQHFLRLLGQEAVSQSYAEVFRAAFPFPALSDGQRAQLDPESLSFFDLVAPRVPDGRRLYAALRSEGEEPVLLPAGLDVAQADVPMVEHAAAQWVSWCDELFSEADGAVSPWSAERMEYSLSVAASFTEGEEVLTAREYAEGQLDWHSFDLGGEGDPLGAPSDIKSVIRTTIPAPVTYPGMPASRFWEFEDARVDFGSVDAGPTDLARMLLVEFALAYGNDWFVIPVELEVGTLCRTRSLVVTDTFGVRTLIRPSGDTGGQRTLWGMFQLSVAGQPLPAPNIFFLPPSLLKSVEGRPVEEVLFLRDEMANMVWAVERVVESPAERPVNRFEAYAEKQRRREQESPPAPPAPGPLRYRLMTEVPDYWIPLLPTLTETGLRLRRGGVYNQDGGREFISAQGRILESGQQLSLYEEEVPREGVRVTRSFQFTRWTDGSSHLWVGRRKEVGRGEGSSGLRFDRLHEE